MLSIPRLLFYIGFVVVGALLMAPQGFAALAKEVANGKPPVLIATIRPLALMAHDLAGDLVEIEVLLSGASSPHDFSLTIGQALTLNDADMVLWVGPNVEAFMSKGVRRKRSLAMLDEEGGEGHGEDDNAGDSEDRHEKEHHAEHEATHVARHPWLEVEAVKDYSERLTEALVGLLPQHEASLRERQQAFVSKLMQRKANIVAALGPYAEARFLVHHDAYSGFVADYGLRQPLTLTRVPHERVSAKRLNAIAKEAASLHCLLAEASDEINAGRYAALLGLPVVSVDLLAASADIGDFDAYQRAVADAFARCLSTKLSAR